MKRHLPNALTCCNLLAGCAAVFHAFAGFYDVALLFIVVGALFDFLDGMAARLLGVSSPIGKELDSLADIVTFGMAPATMLFYELCVVDYPVALEPARSWLPFAAYVMTAFSALRLAKFNVDTRQQTSFIGLPTPANALFWSSLLLDGSVVGCAEAYALPLLLGLMLLSCYLLVAELPMFALKFKHFGWRGNRLRYVFLVACLPLIVVFGLLSPALIVVFYMLLSAAAAIRARRRH